MDVISNTIKTYAKVNLSLDIVGIRYDGYHLIDTIMQSVSLYDEIKIDYLETDSDFSIEIDTNKDYVPKDERNLAYRAAKLMADVYLKRKGKNVTGNLKIYINKKIPVSAGLAGGSGNAAGVIVLLNRMWGLGLSTKALCAISKGIGSDIPFLVLNTNTKYGVSRATGVGEDLEPIRTKVKWDILLVKPNFGVSTKEVYRGMDLLSDYKIPNNDKLELGLIKGKIYDCYSNMINVLEEYTLANYPEVEKLKERVKRLENVNYCLMSGSGPTIVGFFEKEGSAKLACEELRREGYEAYWARTR